MKTLQLNHWDYSVLSAYVLILVFLGYRAYRRTDGKSADDFLLGNRLLSLPAFVATLVTTWYGGILGIGEFAYLYGISSWFIFGLPYYIFAGIFAIILAGKIRRAGHITIADMFYTHHSKAVGILGSVFLLFMTTPAPYILMVALLLQIILGWSFISCLLLGTIISTCYVYFGGFRSVVQTDKFQFLLIYSGFFLLFFFLVKDFGGYSYLSEQLPPLHLTWHGGNTFQYMIVWFFLASWTFIDPGFHQRCAAARSTKIARRGIFISILFWFIFDFLTISTGLYAVAILQDIDPVLAYPLLADKLLPPFLKGLFITGLLAVIMSTIDSFSLLSAITFGRDLLWRFKEAKETALNSYTRIGLIITAAISVLLCLLFPSVIELWYVIGSLFIPPMILPLITAYYPGLRLSGNQTLFIMIFSFSLSLISFVFGQFNIQDGYPGYLFAIEPFFFGILACIFLYLLFKIFGKKTHMSDSSL